jgi:hypothetical protein
MYLLVPSQHILISHFFVFYNFAYFILQILPTIYGSISSLRGTQVLPEDGDIVPKHVAAQD